MDLRNLLRSKKKRLKTVDPPGASTAMEEQGAPPPPRDQAVELGTIDYCNITPDGRHGDFDAAIQAASETGKPIFANFVEWSG